MFGFDRKQKAILHLTWMAFFLTFLTWFNMAPFNTTLQNSLSITTNQIKILMICNVALTIPARIAIGSLVDHYGPKKIFILILIFAGGISIHFALAQTFSDLIISRLLMGIVGASFVVGIKMIAEWFPPEKMGTAQGLYAGWGNFGAAAAAFTLPPIAALFSPEDGWRIATGISGGFCFFWAWIYYKYAHEVPSRAPQFPVGLENTIEVTSQKDLVLQILLMFPLFFAFAFFIWKLSTPPTQLIPDLFFWVILTAMFGILIQNIYRCYRFNISRIRSSIPNEKKYEFRQTVILSLVYALTFGSELAVVSMFPEFLENSFNLSVTIAGVLGSSFAFFNLISRPSGGWLSDKFGRKPVMLVLVFGSILCYWFMGNISSSWSLTIAITLAIICSLLVQAGNGACFAMVPLIRKDLTGKMAGVVGAYGNVGAVFFLTLLSLVEDTLFFKIISGYAFLVFISLFLLKPFNTLHSSFK